jgi:hypothetical protein
MLLKKKKKGIQQELYKMAAQCDLSKQQLTELKVHIILYVLQRYRSQNHSHSQKVVKNKDKDILTFQQLVQNCSNCLASPLDNPNVPDDRLMMLLTVATGFRTV